MGAAAGLCTKEERAAKMGMTALTSDVAAQRRALQTTFIEAETCAASRLAEVDAVRAAVENACGIKLPSAPAEATVRPVSHELCRSSDMVFLRCLSSQHVSGDTDM